MDDFFMPSKRKPMTEVIYVPLPGHDPKAEVFIPHFGMFKPGVPTAIPADKAAALTGPGGAACMKMYEPEITEPYKGVMLEAVDFDPAVPSPEVLAELEEMAGELMPEPLTPADEAIFEEMQAPHEEGESKKKRKK